MIDRIEGIVQEVSDNRVIIQTYAISWDIIVPDPSVYILNEKASLYMYVHWNQEQGPSLYGFLSSFDRAAFSAIIGCNGVGPKLAVALLHDLGASGFVQAITMHDDQALSNVTGIGAKKAEQIIVSLKHKINKLIASSNIDLSTIQATSVWRDVDLALVSLNYSRQEINRTLDILRKDSDAHALAFDQLMRRALAHITRKQ